jgi:hypothetical protein
MGVTRERVRQIEAQALSRLRHPAIRRSSRSTLDRNDYGRVTYHSQERLRVGNLTSRLLINVFSDFRDFVAALSK